MKEQIIEAVNNENWDEALKLIKKIQNKDNFIFGLQKGYINLLHGSICWELIEQFQNIGVKTFICDTLPDFQSKVKKGEINPELVKNEYVLVMTNKSTVISRLLSTDKWKVNYFKITNRSRKDKKTNEYITTYTITYDVDKKLSFKSSDNQNFLLGLLREYRINSILED